MAETPEVAPKTEAPKTDAPETTPETAPKEKPPERPSVAAAEKLKLIREKADNKEALDLAAAVRKAAAEGDIDKMLELTKADPAKAANWIKKKVTPPDRLAQVEERLNTTQAALKAQQDAQVEQAQKAAREAALATLEASTEIPWVKAVNRGKDVALEYVAKHEAETGEKITLMEAAKIVNERYKAGMAEQFDEILALPEGEAMLDAARAKKAAKTAPKKDEVPVAVTDDKKEVGSLSEADELAAFREEAKKLKAKLQNKGNTRPGVDTTVAPASAQAAAPPVKGIQYSAGTKKANFAEWLARKAQG